LPGVALYEAYGFRILEKADALLADGTMIACYDMAKPIN
jgi:hypothetical protein